MDTVNSYTVSYPSRPRSAGQEFLDVGGLDARRMPGSGFGPVPGTPAARVELEVLLRTQALDLVTRSLDPTDRGKTGWGMRWKLAINAFAITFGDRFPAAEAY